jgi:hypothetical protein
MPPRPGGNRRAFDQETPMTVRKLPIGIQNFEDLRGSGYLYVDKTAYVHLLATTGKPYFLGRPRRFGKSLFLSTLKAYFSGKKELFDGLALAALEEDWLEYPVLHIDFSIGSFANLPALNDRLSVILDAFEKVWGKTVTSNDPASRLAALIERAHEQSGQKVVVLVDEYDKPLLGTMDDLDVSDAMRNALKSFYGVFKGMDAHLRFVFLTGVTKFSKVSIFSDLNQLRDISLDRRFAGICGVSEAEMRETFMPEIGALAEQCGMSRDEALAELKKRYDGYHFSKESEGLYNPYSLLNTFAKQDFADYWYETGTPTFLVKLVRNLEIDIRKFDNDVVIGARDIDQYRHGETSPIPILYQSGYLTIKRYDRQFDEYVLGFPNEEVRYGFLNDLFPAYAPESRIRGGEFAAARFVKDLLAGNIDGFMTRLRAFFAAVPYDLSNKSERDYQTIFYLLFTLMGQFCQTEVKSAKGRADAVVKTSDRIYVFEFKLDENGTAEAALAQIDDKGYLIPYIADGCGLVKIGVAFSRDGRGISRWLAAN